MEEEGVEKFQLYLIELEQITLAEIESTMKKMGLLLV